jgi:hypothetical protein
VLSGGNCYCGMKPEGKEATKGGEDKGRRAETGGEGISLVGIIISMHGKHRGALFTPN